MSKAQCPLGPDCDLTLAYMMGAEKAKDTIIALRNDCERLRAALEGLLQCPHIADRDIEPAWIEPETEDAIAIARAALEVK